MHVIIWKIIWRYEDIRKQFSARISMKLQAKVLEYKLDKKICVFSLENKMDDSKANSILYSRAEKAFRVQWDQ